MHRGPLVAVAVAALVSSCDGDAERHGDTAVVADTAPRGDTLLRVDTMVALGIVEAAGQAPRDREGGADTVVSASDLAYLRARRLLIPVARASPSGVFDSFAEMRGTRRHNAVDIPAPRGTPVLAADSGWVLKLHTSVAGGLAIYATGPERRFVYYYAHLDRYRDGLAEGRRLVRGDTIGFVGTTGNAPPNLPHLHFAIARMDPDGSWWKGTPIDPYPLLAATAAAVARPR